MISAITQNRLRVTAIVLLFINGLNALAAGFSFMVDPSGSGLGMTTAYLQHSPFPNFLVPGIILFIANVAMSTIVDVMTIKKSRFYPLLLSLQGCILLGWIIIQLLLLQFFHPLHLLMGGLGMALIAIGTFLEKHASV